MSDEGGVTMTAYVGGEFVAECMECNKEWRSEDRDEADEQAQKHHEETHHSVTDAVHEEVLA